MEEEATEIQGIRRRRAPRLSKGERRAHLLEAAAQVLTEVGFEGLTMEAVVRRAEVSRGLGYVYFPNAEELAFALYEREVAEVYQRLRAAAPENAGFEARMRAAVSAYLDYSVERGSLLAILQTKLSGRRQKRSLSARLDPLLSAMAELIAAEYATPPKPARALAGALLAAADALARSQRAGLLTRAQAEALCAQFLSGGLRAALGPAAE